MTQKAYPLNDTLYTAEDVRLFHVARHPGIFNATGTDLQVRALGGLNIGVLPGYAFLLTGTEDIGGVTFGSTEEEGFTVDTPGSIRRYDYISVRYTKTSNTAQLLYVKGGTSYPTPVRNASTYELIVAIIEVPANASSITSANIIDVRLDEKYCGLVVDGTARVPTESMQEQFTAFMESIKNTLSSDAAGNLLNMINSVSSNLSQAQQKINQLEGEFAGHVLFNGASTGDITMNDSVDNYRCIDIQFENYGRNHVRLYPDAKTLSGMEFQLSSVMATSSTMQISLQKCAFSKDGRSITRGTQYYRNINSNNISGGPQSPSNITIYKVVGYK